MYQIEVIRCQGFAILKFDNAGLMQRLAIHSHDIIPLASLNAIMHEYTNEGLSKLVKEFLNPDVIRIKELN